MKALLLPLLCSTALGSIESRTFVLGSGLRDAPQDGVNMASEQGVRILASNRLPGGDVSAAHIVGAPSDPS